jgi:hypothetical protein
MCETTLLHDATATVYLDGLIFLLPNSRSGMCRALIHTGAEHHALRIEITECDGHEHEQPSHAHALPSSDHALPSKRFDWKGSQKCLRAGAPFWLYVDSGSGRPDTSSVSLYKPDDLAAERSFGHVLDFETRFYDHGLDFHASPPAVELNFAHGTFYSANNTKVMLKSFSPHETISAASTIEETTSSVLVGVDFDAKSDEGDERYLVLEQTNPSPDCTPTKEIFRLKLMEGTHYLVKLLNIPVYGGQGPHRGTPEHHFMKYYDLFSLREGERFFFVMVPDAPDSKHHPSSGPMHTEQSPPCNVGVGSKTEVP